MEGRGKGDSFCDFTCYHKLIDWLQCSSLSGFLEIDIYTSQTTIHFVVAIDKSRPEGYQVKLG